MSVYKISVRFLKSHLRTEHLTKAILFWREWGLGWEILTAAEKKSQPKHSNKKIHPAYNPLSFSVTIHNLPLSLLLSLSLCLSLPPYPTVSLTLSISLCSFISLSHPQSFSFHSLFRFTTFSPLYLSLSLPLSTSLFSPLLSPPLSLSFLKLALPLAAFPPRLWKISK